MRIDGKYPTGYWLKIAKIRGRLFRVQPMEHSIKVNVSKLFHEDDDCIAWKGYVSYRSWRIG